MLKTMYMMRARWIGRLSLVDGFSSARGKERWGGEVGDVFFW